MDWSKLNVAITGASSGIGAAAALELARRGAALALGARRTSELQKVAAECRRAGAREVLWTRLDVREWKDQAAFASACRDRIGPVDVAVANSGYGNIGNTLDMDPHVIEDLYRTNTIGSVWTIRAFGAQLEERRGHAIVVGSVVSKIPTPYSSVYASTKWALRGWTRGARPELESRGIALTLFNPGYVRTDFFKRRALSGPVAAWDPGRGMSAEQVARRLMRAIRRRPAEMEMTALSRFAIPTYRLMPIHIPRILAWMVRERADLRRIKK